MTLILVVILVALAFESISGFHDTAKSIATVTKRFSAIDGQMFKKILGAWVLTLPASTGVADLARGLKIAG